METIETRRIAVEDPTTQYREAPCTGVHKYVYVHIYRVIFTDFSTGMGFGNNATMQRRAACEPQVPKSSLLAQGGHDECQPDSVLLRCSDSWRPLAVAPRVRAITWECLPRCESLSSRFLAGRIPWQSLDGAARSRRAVFSVEQSVKLFSYKRVVSKASQHRCNLAGEPPSCRDRSLEPESAADLELSSCLQLSAKLEPAANMIGEF